MDSTLTYQKLLAEILTDHVSKILKTAEPGHCLRLEGPPFEVLIQVCIDLQTCADGAKVVLLSNTSTESYEVSATKLIELRNAAEDSHPLLVLIPSNLRTAAEDSFDRATFKQIPVESFPQKVVAKLHASLPEAAQRIFSRINVFLDRTFERIFYSDWARYLLACQADQLDDAAWGKNLHHLGMIPDRGLLVEDNMLEQRLFQNIAAVHVLQDEKNPLIARINNLQISANRIQKPLFEFLSQQPQVEDIAAWGEKIANDKTLAHLDLKNWPFLDLRPPEELEVFFNPLTGQQIVRSKGDSLKRILTKKDREVKISISFSTRPSPMQVNTLTHFRVDLMRTVEQGEIETVVTLVKFKKSAGKTSKRSKQIALSPREIAEGTYFFRLIALDEAGVVLNRNDAFKDPDTQAIWEERLKNDGENAARDDLIGKRTSDSEDFVFEIEESGENGDGDTLDSMGKRQKTGSLFQALFKIRQDYIKGKQQKDLGKIIVEEMIWSDQGKGQGKECTLEIRFNDIRHHYIVPMAVSLRDITHQMLKTPDKLGTFRFDLTIGLKAENTHLRDNQLSLSAPESFMDARHDLFKAILATVKDDDDNAQGVVESCNFEELGEQVEIYLAAYQQWMDDLLVRSQENLSEAVLEEIKKLQLLDHVEMWVHAPTGRKERMILLTPLHPLKLGWFLQRQRVYLDWEEKSLADTKPGQLWTKEVQNLFLGDFHANNHPLVVHGANLKSYYYAGELAPGWAAYLPVAILNVFQEDKSLDRSWLNQIQHLLGIPTALRDLVGYSHISIYRHIRRYLIQHPYVEVLHLNLFNPGDARKLVECLKLLQKEKPFDDLRYEIRLFASDERLATAGTAFDDFLNPSRDVAEEADAFTVPSENALFPKIRFSRNRYADYQKQPEKFSAHLSFMIETLPVTVLLERPSDNPRPSVFCYGLMVRPIHKRLGTDGAVAGWSHFLSINSVQPLSEDDSLTNMLVTSLDKSQHLVAMTLAGRWTEDSPALSLKLDDIQRTMLYQVHQTSDWVITIDQNMGVDFYDTPSDEDCIPYLLDYSPGSAGEKTPFYITTRPASEILGLFLPHLNRLDLSMDHHATPVFRFLELLRSVSAVMLMQSISSPNKAMETIGMGLSRMLLERLGVLEDQFIIPLDPHLDLFETVKQASEDPMTAQRGDLLLVSCDAPTETIHIHVVEVKCRTRIGSQESLSSLMSKMTEQMEQSILVLQHHFDPNFRDLYRLDQALKDHQFSELCLFYLERAKRYGLLRERIYEDDLHFLSGLYGRHRLTFNKLGLIFEFEGEHEEIIQTRQSEDLVFFHAGYNVIKESTASRFGWIA